MNLFGFDLTLVLTLAIAMAGAALIALGVRRQVQGLSRSWQTDRSLRTALGGFRMMVIGIGLLGAAAGWHYGIAWLLVFSLAFAGEETFESSLMLGAMPSSGTRNRSQAR
ncbi:MAG TPA: hypothetical protein VFP05_00525 [Thermomicrobiales bacterium]|nr:hypothetical protein [Thermomicrobiales bacterium]